MRIVLVDDSPTNLIVLRTLSAKAGGDEIVSFSDAEQAIAYLMHNQADLIVVDYSMPKITGTEFIKRMRASPRHAETAILMVTSSSEMAVRRRAIEVGATEFLTKPVKINEFMARVASLTDTPGALAVSS